MSTQPRILFIDAYDSFSNNIIALLTARCGAHITKIHIDTCVPDVEAFLKPYVAVVCGPGPGHPAYADDVGLFKRIWALSDRNMIPVLGICLGFQSLAYEYGAAVRRLPQPRHGVQTRVLSSSVSIFAGLPEIDTIQYHSLYADLGWTTYDELKTCRVWEPLDLCPELQPLAWEIRAEKNTDAKFRQNPRSILMAIRHTRKPFYGIQFHPESICSEDKAQQVVTNWWHSTIVWIASMHPSRLRTFDIGALAGLAVRKSHKKRDKPSTIRMRLNCNPNSNRQGSFPEAAPLSLPDMSKRRLRLASVTLPLQNMTVPSIAKALDLTKGEGIILDSEMRQLPVLGQTSIIGIIHPDCKKLQYSVGAKTVSLRQGDETEIIDLSLYDDGIFSFIKAFMSRFEIDDHHERPFCGGLMGYIGYEACLETIGVSVPPQPGGPDICFAFIERSIVIDHSRRLVYIQELHVNGASNETSEWLDDTRNILGGLAKQTNDLNTEYRPFSVQTKKRILPEEHRYKSKISQCKESISAGDAYELCLTDQSSISLSGTAPSSWDMYRSLRRLNPAPFAGYVRLGPLTLLSTSPERFMNWSRPEPVSDDGGDGASELSTTCQFRPIKGTVQKRRVKPDGSIHKVSRKEAESVLTTQKERAENLMIVDLIRHDLYGVCRDVCVKDLMIVEEYESVYQLVSVIEGHISSSSRTTTKPERSGIDCLAASLPPGSMTGAPKRRACQLLREIEDYKPRSVYSGVLGYMCVSGKGDFSVVIRSLYKWDDGETASAAWNIGAGGAITTLSTEEDEWEEMLAKLQSTYRLFDA